MSAKSLVCIRKKLHKPMKDQIVLISEGCLASLIAFSLFLLGLIPSSVRVNLPLLKFLLSEFAECPHMEMTVVLLFLQKVVQME